ncbi:Hypothetical predicted protein [Xyrichtys novacula]|uniref:Uncharacterized protein n=1 Tax=Xyrichtys novacula TaxID=13765 RepID=A0AAV1FP10_XYRNO|nr:Hypothetical predicted protein [Xyrichtys novacula]
MSDRGSVMCIESEGWPVWSDPTRGATGGQIAEKLMLDVIRDKEKKKEEGEERGQGRGQKIWQRLKRETQSSQYSDRLAELSDNPELRTGSIPKQPGGTVCHRAEQVSLTGCDAQVRMHNDLSGSPLFIIKLRSHRNTPQLLICVTYVSVVELKSNLQS